MTSPAQGLPRYSGLQDCNWTGPGKCLQGGCRYSLLADRPRIKDWEPEHLEELIDAMPSTCAVDLASLGPMLLDEISVFTGLPRPQVEQLEILATRKLSRLRELRRAHWDGQ